LLANVEKSMWQLQGLDLNLTLLKYSTLLTILNKK